MLRRGLFSATSCDRFALFFRPFSCKHLFADVCICLQMFSSVCACKHLPRLRLRLRLRYRLRTDGHLACVLSFAQDLEPIEECLPASLELGFKFEELVRHHRDRLPILPAKFLDDLGAVGPDHEIQILGPVARKPHVADIALGMDVPLVEERPHASTGEEVAGLHTPDPVDRPDCRAGDTSRHDHARRCPDGITETDIGRKRTPRPFLGLFIAYPMSTP